CLDRLKAIKHTHNLFKLQQVLFIADRTSGNSHAGETISQQFSSQHRCINATDLHIFTLFLKIVEDCILNWSCEVGLFCMFSNPGPFFVCSYPHDKVNRLSCDEARNYYSGVVSLIPLTLELLQRMASSYTYCSQDTTSAGNPNVDVLESSGQRGGTAGVGDVSFSLTGYATGAHNTKKTQAKRTGAWHAIKPAWRPPGLTTRIRTFPLFYINQHCNKVCFSWFDL
uniref:Uncharacterized protein n=1 Tax=Oncorhynchus kisutch TaxID=8019 RepID=A0A8C7D6R0_ONCKI